VDVEVRAGPKKSLQTAEGLLIGGISELKPVAAAGDASECSGELKIGCPRVAGESLLNLSSVGEGAIRSKSFGVLPGIQAPRCIRAVLQQWCDFDTSSGNIGKHIGQQSESCAEVV